MEKLSGQLGKTLEIMKPVVEPRSKPVTLVSETFSCLSSTQPSSAANFHDLHVSCVKLCVDSISLNFQDLPLKLCYVELLFIPSP